MPLATLVNTGNICLAADRNLTSELDIAFPLSGLPYMGRASPTVPPFIRLTFALHLKGVYFAVLYRPPIGTHSRPYSQQQHPTSSGGCYHAPGNTGKHW